MRPNVIILTSGLTGSSVLTGLISRAGYWTGASTHKKKDYDTFENEELIDLNLSILEQSGYKGNYLLHFSPKALDQVSSLFPKVDTAPFRTFVQKCNQHSPWVWKDPRLWLTIRFWKNLMDLEQCKFILLTRASRQLWVSTTLRRQIISYKDSKAFEQRVKQWILDFLDTNKLSYLELSYEDLILHPAETIIRLNSHLETSLTVADLESVYHKPLHQTPNSPFSDYVKAMLIYIKNYSERADPTAETK